LPCLPRFTHHMSVSAKRKSREFRAVLSVARRHKSSQAVEEEITVCTLHRIRPREKEISDQAVQTARCKHMLQTRKHDVGTFFISLMTRVSNRSNFFRIGSTAVAVTQALPVMKVTNPLDRQMFTGRSVAAF